MSRKLLAFCLRLVCIEFVYILFSHSPFEQVCKRFPDAETVTFCDIRRRERLPVLCLQAGAATGFPHHEQRASRLHNQAHPPERPPPLMELRAYPLTCGPSQALELVGPVSPPPGSLHHWGGVSFPPNASEGSLYALSRASGRGNGSPTVFRHPPLGRLKTR